MRFSTSLVSVKVTQGLEKKLFVLKLKADTGIRHACSVCAKITYALTEYEKKMFKNRFRSEESTIYNFVFENVHIFVLPKK